jgi:hypothetical protein
MQEQQRLKEEEKKAELSRVVKKPTQNDVPQQRFTDTPKPVSTPREPSALNRTESIGVGTPRLQKPKPPSQVRKETQSAPVIDTTPSSPITETQNGIKKPPPFHSRQKTSTIQEEVKNNMSLPLNNARPSSDPISPNKNILGVQPDVKKRMSHVLEDVIGEQVKQHGHSYTPPARKGSSAGLATSPLPSQQILTPRRHGPPNAEMVRAALVLEKDFKRRLKWKRLDGMFICT